jgi:hypothetical protein
MLYRFATSSIDIVARRVLSAAIRALGILIKPEVPKSEASLPFATVTNPRSVPVNMKHICPFSTNISQKKALTRRAFCHAAEAPDWARFQ